MVMQNIQATQSKSYSWQDNSLRLELYIQTRASKDAFIGEYGERLKVAVSTTPIDGKANKKLIKFLSKYFAVPQNQVQIIAGIHSHYKSILIIEPKQNVCSYPK
jgi:hypothetical protein